MKIHGWTDSCPKVSRLFASADKVERRRKRTAVLTVCACSVSLSLPWDSRVFTRETRMELNSCSSQDDTSAVFVRDWRLRKITTVNNNLANQDTAPIVRTRTVITIGSVNELDGPALQQDDQTISASEVGETACGRISITVKTIPKSPSIRVIPKENPIFSPTLHAEEEWTLRDTVPFKSSSVSDPSWIYVPSQPDRSKILQRPQWQEDKLSRDIDSALADNQQLCRTLSNKKSSYTLTEIDMSPSVDSRKVNSDHGITNKVLDSPKIHLKPTFRMTFGDETKILRLTDTSSSEKNVRKVEKASSTARSPIGYHEWLKSLDRLEGESYPNQIHSSDDEKVKHQDTKSIKSIDRTPVGTAHKSSDINQPVGFVETSPSKSILKSVQNESDIRPETVNLVQNQLHKDVAATIVHEVSSVVCKSSLTKPINSLIDTKDVQDCTDRKSSSRLVGWVPKSNNTDSKFNKIVPTNGNQLAVAPKMVDCTTNPLATAMKADRANNVEVVNKNQINSMKSLSSSGSWKNNSNTQDGMNGPALSSGMDLSKATELVKQFFNTGNDEETDNNPSDSLTTDKQPLNVTKSNLLAEDPTLSTISHQSAATLPTSSGSPKFQPGSVQDQRYDANHHRGRPAIKSKIPLRIPRPASSSACSHSVNNSTLTAPSVAYVDKGNHIPSSRNCAFNKAKSSLNMPSKIKPPSTGSAVRTRSVENLRQTSPLSSYVLYSNIMTARDDGTSHHHYQ